LLKYIPRIISKRIQGRIGLIRAVRNTAWLFADHLFRLGVTFAVGVWLARYLGPEQFGKLSYAFAIVALFSGFATLGLRDVVVRDIIRERLNLDEILGTAFFLRVAGAVTAVVLTVALGWALRGDDESTRWMIFIIALGTLFQVFDVIEYWFQAEVQLKYPIIARNIAFSLINIAKIILILADAPLISFAWAALVEGLLGGAAMFAVFRIRDGRVSSWTTSLKRARRILAYCWPIVLSSLVVMTYLRIDQVMLGEMSTFSEVGNFAVSVRLVESLYFVPMAITASVFPALLASKELSADVYEARMQALFDLLIWLAILGALATSVLSPWIIRILFGSSYVGAAPVLALHAWMAVAVFFGVARQKWLYAENALRHGAYVEVTAMVLNIGANFLLIPIYGAWGAALASLIMAIGANLLVSIYSRPIRHSLWMYWQSLILPLRWWKARCAA